MVFVPTQLTGLRVFTEEKLRFVPPHLKQLNSDKNFEKKNLVQQGLA